MIDFDDAEPDSPMSNKSAQDLTIAVGGKLTRLNSAGVSLQEINLLNKAISDLPDELKNFKGKPLGYYFDSKAISDFLAKPETWASESRLNTWRVKLFRHWTKYDMKQHSELLCFKS